MKNKINLNQLSMSWNEKQKPQRFARYAAMLIMLLTLGVGQMWAEYYLFKATCQEQNSQCRGSAVATFTGSGDPNYSATWLSNTSSNSYFFVTTNNSSTEQNNTDYLNGETAFIENTDYSLWKYETTVGQYNHTRTLSSPTVGNIYRFTLWSKGGDELGFKWEGYGSINDILNGNKVMFYYGVQWDENHFFIYNADNTSNKVYDSYRIGSTTIGSDEDVKYTFAVRPTGTYYFSSGDNWVHGTGASVSGGAMYYLHSISYGNNELRIGTAVAPTWTTSSSTITEGDASCSLAATCSNSVIGRTQTISYYYTQDDGDTWTEFDPSDVDDLSTGTYTVRALAFDGNIYVRTESAATLTVNPACTTPTISWGTAPSNGTVGGSMTVSVTSNYPAGVTLSSSTANATLTGRTVLGSTVSYTLNYVSAGTPRISAQVVGDGSTYCSGTVTPTPAYYDITVSAAAADSWAFYQDGSKTCDFTNVSGTYTTGVVNIDAAYATTAAGGTQTKTLYYYLNGSNMKCTGAYSLLTGAGDPTVALDGNGAMFWQDAPGKYNITIKKVSSTWKIKADRYYTVTFSKNGQDGASATASQDIVSGGKVTEPSDPSLSGYDFAGWYEEESCTNAWNFSTGTISANKTLFAKWTPASYAVTISGNATGDPASGTIFTYGSSVSMVVTPNSGYKITNIEASNAAISASADGNATGSWTVTGTMPATAVTLTVTTAAVPEIRLLGRFKIYNSTRSSYSTISSNDWTTDYAQSTMAMTYNHQTGYYDLPTYRSAAELKADGNLYFYLHNGTNKYGSSSINLVPDSSYPGSANAQYGNGSNFYMNSSSDLLFVVLHFDPTNLKLWFTGTEDTEYSTIFNAGEYGSISADGTAISANSSASVDIGFERTLTATPASAYYEFVRWETTGSVSVANSTSTSTTVTATGAGGTVTAVWALNCGWYITGNDPFPGWGYDKKTAPFDQAYPGQLGVFYREVTLTSGDKYFKVSDGSSEYGPASDGTVVAKNGEAISFTNASGYGAYKCNISGTVWFVIDLNNNKLSIKEPSFLVSFGDNLGENAVSAVNGSSVSLISGNAYPVGTSITFSKSDPAGYDFLEWNSEADGSGTQLGTGSTYSVASLSSDVSVYAIYSEHIYTVTVANGAGGSVSTTSVTAGPATESSSITATANTGYYFTGWTYSVDGKVTEHQSSYTGAASTLTINATAAVTMTANFAVRYALVGATKAADDVTEGMPGWDSGDAVAFSYSDGTYTINRTLTKPNTNYSFKVIDRRANEWIWYGLSTSETWINMNTATNLTSTNNNAHMYSLGTGSYTFTVTEQVVDAVTYPRVTISNPVSWQVHMGAVTDNGQAGGSATAEDGESNTIVNDNWVKNSGSVTFTHSAAASGYEFVDWRTSSTYGGGSQLGTGDTYTASSIAADVYAYAHFKETKHTITLDYTGLGEIQDGGGDAIGSVSVGTYTTATITAVPATGYYFTGWTIPDGVTVTSGSSSTATITIKTTSDDKTVTANFHADDKIYFDNKYTQWTNVWVYLFSEDVWYEYTPDEGVHPSWAGRVVTYAQMTKVPGEDNLYEYAYHNSSHNYSFSHVAFAEADQHDNTAFYDMHCAYRSDWHTNLPVYVATSGHELRNGTAKYHSGGYWRPYNPKAGESVKYYLDVFSGTADFQGETQYFKASGDGSLVAEVSARLTTANSTYTFGVHSDAGGDNNQHYAEGTTITNENSDNYLKLYKYNSGWNISVKTSAEGIYTFVLSMEYDSLRFSVIYPASVGDYRLTYSYDSPAQTRSSDVIKKKVADAGAVHTSIYVDPTNTYSQLILERCSTITDGKPVWETRKTFNHTYVTSNFSEKEVYEMDVNISGTNGDASTLTNIAKYTGPFYIKTDCATGGWADYTKNVLEQNSINYSASDSKTFNYYFVKYIDDARKKYGTNGWDACNLFDNAGSKTNIKCVIANMYNHSISDTLKSDAITGDGQETLPMPGSVRFSYNSATNEVKRTYLNGSTCWNDAYLLLTADKTIKTPANVDIAGNATTFADKNNWVYELRIKAPETTNVWLKATFNGTPQDLIGTSSSYVQLIGGSDASNYQLLRIIYDFKTNKLIAAWEPDQEMEYDTPIDLASDVLMIHNRRTVTAATAAGEIDDVTMINLTTGGEFTGIGRVYCAMRFQKADADGYLGLKYNDAGVENGTISSAESYYRFNYWISFPYDVKMTDIFGIDGYGSKWRIQRYRGDLRAQNGWYLGDGVGSFWETIPMGDTETLNAKEGYVLQLSPSAFRNSSMWNNSVTERYLYFPSGTGVNAVNYTTSSISLPSEGYVCTKGLFTDPTQAALGYSHDVTDSHWHVFGIPTFNNATGTTGTGTYYTDDNSDEYPTPQTPISGGTFYFYVYNNNGTTYNTYTATSSSGFTFQPMHAYMIQMTGTLNFTTNSVPASVAARRNAEAQNFDLKVEVKNDNEVLDQAFISMRENAEADFAFNEDMMKIHNNGKTNIYSYAGPYDVAANVMPIENSTVSLGVEAAVNGLYTFSMPSNFNGQVVLFDNITGARTNLTLGDYEVTLPKGTYNDRFYLEFTIHNAPTSIDGVEGGSFKDGKAHKFVQNGVMYILRDGKVFDARGAKIK